jgi:hypothetical protein
MNEITSMAGLRPNPATDPFCDGALFDTQYHRDFNQLEASYDGPIPQEAKDRILHAAERRRDKRRIDWLIAKERDCTARHDAIVKQMRQTNNVDELKRLNNHVESILAERADYTERRVALQMADMAERTIDAVCGPMFERLGLSRPANDGAPT